MMTYKLTVLRLSDLESASIRCETCKAVITLRLGTREQVPQVCPACRQPFGEVLRKTLVDLLTFYVNLGEPKTWPKIELQIKSEIET